MKFKINPLPYFRYGLTLGIFFLMLLQPRLSSAADVHTTDGQTFSGKILEEQDGFVLVQMEDGVQVKIERAQIVYVQHDEEMNVSPQDYPALGLTYGSPALFNAVAAYYWRDLGVKLSGGDWSNFWGGQLNLSKKLVDNKSFLGAFSLVGGYVGINKISDNFSTWGIPYAVTHGFTYGGLGFDLNWGGFALEADCVAGDFPNQIAFPFQVGYVYRFN